MFNIPRFTATQELSGPQKKIKNLTNRTGINLGKLASEQSGRLRGLLGTNVDIGNEETEARLFELGSKRLNPLFETREDQLRTRLANQGIQAGSEAFGREFEQLNQGRNDAFNQLLLQGRGQSVQEQLTERNQPINEISALLSGSQVSQPNFVGTPNNQIPTTDFAGIMNQDFQNRLGQFNANAANRSQALGTVGGLFGSLLSDRRAKKNIKKVGKVEGHNVYRFNYRGEKDGAQRHIGLMAQEVEKKNPAAVKNLFGLKVVDYDKALGN